MAMLFDTVPGFVCPYCGADCSPIAGGPCSHYFLADGENGWRFTPLAQSLHDAAQEISTTLFRDLLYHDNACREHLRLRRVIYDDSLEMYAFSGEPEETGRAFRAAIAEARKKAAP